AETHCAAGEAVTPAAQIIVAASIRPPARSTPRPSHSRTELEVITSLRACHVRSSNVARRTSAIDVRPRSGARCRFSKREPFQHGSGSAQVPPSEQLGKVVRAHAGDT